MKPEEAQLLNTFVSGVINCEKAVNSGLGKHRKCLSIEDLRKYLRQAQRDGVESLHSAANKARLKPKPLKLRCDIRCAAYGCNCDEPEVTHEKT